MTMRFVRMIMAFIVALSVAMLPVAGTAAIAVKSAEMAMPEAAQSADMSVAMDDCCPDPAKPCDQAGQCQSMASCAQPSLGIVNISVADLKYPLVAGSPLPLPVESAVPLHAGSPPFRPPRV